MPLTELEIACMLSSHSLLSEVNSQKEQENSQLCSVPVQLIGSCHGLKRLWSSVSHSFLSDFYIDVGKDKKIKEELEHHMGKVHQMVTNVCLLYFERMRETCVCDS